ncbi:hypothetical protein TNIN_412391, partial [Trichonephila inaurata madagascariensis]
MFRFEKYLPNAVSGTPRPRSTEAALNNVSPKEKGASQIETRDQKNGISHFPRETIPPNRLTLAPRPRIQFPGGNLHDAVLAITPQAKARYFGYIKNGEKGRLSKSQYPFFEKGAVLVKLNET